MKKGITIVVLLLLLLLLNVFNAAAQSFSATSHIDSPGSADAFKGGYTFAYTPSGTPWNGSLISYGGFLHNNYDTQISSDYGPSGGNHISYRTRNGDTNTWNPWNELAVRGANNFTESQTIAGNLGIGTGTANPVHRLEVNGNGVFNGTVISSIANDTGGRIQLINPTKNGNGVASAWMIYNMTGGYGNSLQFWAYDNLSCGGGMCTNRFTIMDNGNVGIGTSNPTNKLDVNGTIHSKEVKIDMNGWSDFVFKKEYNLRTLQEVEKHINEEGHLENIPSEEEVLKNGINLGEMNSKLLQKIEELTLYIIQQEKKNSLQTLEIENSKNEIEILKKQNESFKNILYRLSKIEEKLK